MTPLDRFLTKHSPSITGVSLFILSAALAVLTSPWWMPIVDSWQLCP